MDGSNLSRKEAAYNYDGTLISVAFLESFNCITWLNLITTKETENKIKF